MNPASRLYEFLIALQKRSKENVKLIEIYKDIFNTDDLYKIYKILELFQINLQDIEKEIVSLGRKDRYKILIDQVKVFVLPISLEPYISQYQAVLSNIVPQFMILSDSFANPKYHENDVSEGLDNFSLELDNFLQNIMNSGIDLKTKEILILIVHKLKLSIVNYKFIGISALQENILFFECILNKTEKGKSIFQKLLGIVKVAKDTKEATAFMAQNIDEIQLLIDRVTLS